MNTPIGARARLTTRLTALGAAVLLAAAGLTTGPNPAAAAPGCELSGEGTAESPHLVASADDLKKVGDGDCELSADYRQTANITLTGLWTPIGTFTGSFDGQGFTIAGLTIDLASTDDVGLFRQLNSGASVTGVRLIDANVQGRDKVGALAGRVRGNSSITSSSATGEVIGADKVGGLIGDLDQSTIGNSFFIGDVTDSDSKPAGGLVGESFRGTIINSYATGTVAGGAEVGGLVGKLVGSDPTVTNSYSTSSVPVRSDAGGLVGGSASGTTTASFSLGDPGTSEAGTQLSSAEFTSFATFADAGWPIVDGWAPFDAPDTVWGICSGLNEGRPFLLWQFSADPCTVAPPPTTSTPAPTPSSPVLLGGVAPTQPAGQGVWQQADGTSTPLDVTAPAGNQLRYEAEGVRVTLTGTDATDPSRGLVAAADGEIVCEVCVAAAAGEVIEVWMFSTPRLVAAHRVDGDDECHLLAIPMSAPLDGDGPVSAGAHTLQLAIPTADGMQAINVGLTVGGPVPASVPAGEGSVTTRLDRTGGMLLVALLVAAATALRTGRRTSTSQQ